MLYSDVLRFRYTEKNDEGDGEEGDKNKKDVKENTEPEGKVDEK